MSSDPPGLDPAATSGDVAIRVRDVSKHYLMFQRPEDRFKQMVVPRLQRLVGRPPKRYFTDFAALTGVSFDIRRGETVGVIGRNGSGKSTLLQIVCGTLRPTSGSVEVNGRIAALLELGAGFNPEFTGRENVFLNAAILGVPRREMEWRFDDIARFADIGPFIEQPVKTYSSGMYVRLAFATAINVDPDILVVDEALAVGDEAFQRKCFARIEQIKDRGGTILFVSHAGQTIVQLCSRAMLFDRGELLLEGRPKTVVAQYQRLINASPEAAAEIRAAICAMAAQGPEPEVAAQGRAASSENNRDAPRPANADFPDSTVLLPPPFASGGASGLADYFDPALTPKSTVVLEERGARISGARITMLDGKPVNVLRTGRRYVFEYSVVFLAEATGVGFAFGLRTTTGALLAGASTFLVPAARIARVAANSTKVVSFEFVCAFLPGIYFVSCAARGHVDAEERLLHRILDAVCMRVATEGALTATGLFDINATPRIT
jgi:lipopolysaccharide transport system ATP-binding protein